MARGGGKRKNDNSASQGKYNEWWFLAEGVVSCFARTSAAKSTAASSPRMLPRSRPQPRCRRSESRPPLLARTATQQSRTAAGLWFVSAWVWRREGRGCLSRCGEQRATRDGLLGQQDGRRGVCVLTLGLPGSGSGGLSAPVTSSKVHRCVAFVVPSLSPPAVQGASASGRPPPITAVMSAAYRGGATWGCQQGAPRTRVVCQPTRGGGGCPALETNRCVSTSGLCS